MSDDNNKVIDFDQSKKHHEHARKERKVKTLKKAFASYLAPSAKDKNNKKGGKPKKKR
ncbi:MAG TPA: hypothetical protein VFV48_06195 [Pseudomonadales bacterium]|nr:hypothetical protein [Pseudomonadales bacterium]